MKGLVYKQGQAPDAASKFKIYDKVSDGAEFPVHSSMEWVTVPGDTGKGDTWDGTSVIKRVEHTYTPEEIKQFELQALDLDSKDASRSIEDIYDVLTDAQKAALAPQTKQRFDSRKAKRSE